MGAAKHQRFCTQRLIPVHKLRQTVLFHQRIGVLSGLDPQHHRQKSGRAQGQVRVGTEQGPLDSGGALSVGGDHGQRVIFRRQQPVNVQRRDDLQAGFPGNELEIQRAGKRIAVNEGFFAAMLPLRRAQKGDYGVDLFLRGGDLESRLLVGVL